MEKTKIEILDEVLSFLSSTTTWYDLRQQFPDSSINKEMMRTILRKLIRDNYVDRFSELTLIQKDEELGYVNETKIQRNFEGDLFIEAGGYKQQKINADTENTRVEKLETSQQILMAKLNWMTAWVAIATGSLVIVELLKMMNDHYHWW